MCKTLDVDEQNELDTGCISFSVTAGFTQAAERSLRPKGKDLLTQTKPDRVILGSSVPQNILTNSKKKQNKTLFVN